MEKMCYITFLEGKVKPSRGGGSFYPLLWHYRVVFHFVLLKKVLIE